MSNWNLSVTSTSAVVAAVLKSAAICTLETLCISANPKLRAVDDDSAAVSKVFVATVFVFVFAPATAVETVARILILLPLNVLPKSIAKVFPVGEPPSV